MLKSLYSGVLYRPERFASQRRERERETEEREREREGEREVFASCATPPFGRVTMDFTKNADLELRQLELLPSESLRSRVLTMNSSRDLPPVQGFVTWLKYVVSNLFRVPELNKVLTCLEAQSWTKQLSKHDKLKFVCYLLERDERCYESVIDKDAQRQLTPFTSISNIVAKIGSYKKRKLLFGTETFDANNGDKDQLCLDLILNPNIHAGLIVKLIYWETVEHGTSFRYGYQNQMFERKMIEAMGPLWGKSMDTNDPQVVMEIQNDLQQSAGVSQEYPGGHKLSIANVSPGSPLKLKIKKEKLEPSAVSPSSRDRGGAGTSGASKELSWADQRKTITRIDCICGLNQDRPPMWQCQGKGCGVWQHVKCYLGEETTNHKLRLCFQCRIEMSDPFFVVSPEHKLPRQVAVVSPCDTPQNEWARSWKSPRQKVFRRRFQITKKAFQSLYDKNNKCYLGFASLMVKDKIAHRIHLPKEAEVEVNGKVIKIYDRSSSKELSEKGRDMLVDISSYALIGYNMVTMKTRDSRDFVLVVQLYEDRPLDQVKRHIKDFGVTLEDSDPLLKQKIRQKQALFRTRGDDIGFESIVVSLQCPLSGLRIKNPVKSTACRHVKVFDAETFIEMNFKSKKWQCPHCSKPLLLSDLEVDLYLSKVLEQVKGRKEISMIEINKKGEWRPNRKEKDGDSERQWFRVDTQFDSALLLDDKKEGADHLDCAENNEEEDSSEEELSDGEELRRAIAAANFKKRPRPPPPTPEVIVISDSDEDDDASPADTANNNYTWRGNANQSATSSQRAPRPPVNSQRVGEMFPTHPTYKRPRSNRRQQRPPAYPLLPENPLMPGNVSSRVDQRLELPPDRLSQDAIDTLWNQRRIASVNANRSYNFQFPPLPRGGQPLACSFQLDTNRHPLDPMAYVQRSQRQHSDRAFERRDFQPRPAPRPIALVGRPPPPRPPGYRIPTGTWQQQNDGTWQQANNDPWSSMAGFTGDSTAQNQGTNASEDVIEID